MATRHVLADLVAAAASTGLPSVEIESVGGVDAAARVAAGEAFDLVFLADDALRRLAGDGHVDAGSLTPLVVSQVAVAVRAQDSVGARPAGAAFPNPEGLRTGLRDASRIGYSTGPSGTALVRMIDEWGMTAELDGRLVQARPGIPVAQLLANGEIDLGFQQLSELVGQPGIRILGVLPADCAIDTTFSGAVATASGEPATARRILGFLASNATVGLRRDHSFGTP
jgi:molybdate transport system substrate-binding protein